MSMFPIHSRPLTPFILVLCHTASSIMVPQSYLELHRQETPGRDRGFIVEDVAVDQREREEFSKSIPCVKSFLTKYIEKPAWTSFMVLDGDKNPQEFAHSLATSLDSKFAFFKSSADLDFDVLQPAFATILLMLNATSLDDSFYVLDPCDRGCPFVCVLTTTFPDEQSFLDQSDILVQSMWTRRISKVIVLAKVRDTILAAGSRTFQPNQLCVPSSTVVLDECKENSWSKLKKIRAPRWNECILKVAYFDKSPQVITVNGSEHLKGFEGSLIEEVMRGQWIDREKVEWNDNTSFAEQVQMLLYDDVMADLVVGGILQQSNDEIGYSSTYDMLKVVWLIPKVPNVSLKGLIQPFDSYVWAAVGGSLLLGGVIKTFLSRDLTWLDIFALIIGVPTVKQPSKLSGKIQFVSWSIFGLFLTQLYVDSLADQLINVSDFKLETMKELVDSSFEIGGTAAFTSLFDTFKDVDESLSQIRERFVTFDQITYLKQYQDLLAGRNNSFALVVVLNSSRSHAIETVHSYTITTEPICNFPLALATWKGFPYLQRINEKIMRLIDYGFLDFMINMAISKDAFAMFAIAEDEAYKMELHLQQFVPAFLLVIMGFSVGFILLIIEIIFHPSKLLE
ncbi:uncharacterized protein LOC117604052 [Osmia lignaria lignaria]|uniref:uncharacterized protein LOC117604052 n=1 Tax=Osmia lignaria lignaria TaxID=1437193 RepID=UPI00402B5F77